MLPTVFNILLTAFEACVGWFGDIVDALDARGVLLAAFTIALSVSLLFFPLRGRSGGFNDYKKGGIRRKGASVPVHHKPE